MSSSYGFDIYDLDQVLVQIFGVSVASGPGTTPADEGSFIKIAQDGPSFKTKKGMAGRLVRSKTNEPLTKVELHLLQTSSFNATMSRMWNQDLIGVNGAGVGTFVLQDLQGTSVFTAERIWVTAPPEREWVQEQKGQVWLCEAALVDRLDGGN